jgi:hypothetical protein
MQRPGFGDLADRGAACWLTPDCGREVPWTARQWRELSTGGITGQPLAGVVPVLPTHTSSSPACSQALRTGCLQWRAPDFRHHGAPPVGAQRDLPGSAKRGRPQGLSEAGSGQVSELSACPHEALSALLREGPPCGSQPAPSMAPETKGFEDFGPFQGSGKTVGLTPSGVRSS